MSNPAFLSDGYKRVREEVQQRIKMQLESEYATELAESGFLRRCLLRFRISCEIKRRLGEVARKTGGKSPPDALY